MSARLERISSLIKRELASVLHKSINDKRIGFITILRVVVSKDLSHARIFYSQIGTEKQIEETKKGLYSATRFIHTELCYAIPDLQKMPKLHFKYDHSLEKAVDLVNKINRVNDDTSLK
jgi:ribosome-binding factor A